MITKLEKRLLGTTKNVIFPTCWEELDPVQFVSVICLLLEFKAGRFGIRELQLRLYSELSNISSRKILRKDYEWFEKEIFRNLDKMNFCFKYVYEDPRFKNLDPKMQARLKKINPEQIKGDAEAQIATRFKRSVEIDASFSKQLIPAIYVGLKKISGYTFRKEGDVVETSITASQYSDALTLSSMMGESPDSNIIDLLISTLYCPLQYSSQAAIDNKDKFSKINPAIKYAVLFNFESILSWFANETKYSILFRKSKKNGKIKIGFNSLIYSLSEKGYGTIKDVSDMNLIDMFEIMYNDLVSRIVQMRDSKMEKSEIAKKLGLNIEQINQFV